MVLWERYGRVWRDSCNRENEPGLVGTARPHDRRINMRPILLWLIGIPLPIILLIMLFW